MGKHGLRRFCVALYGFFVCFLQSSETSLWSARAFDFDYFIIHYDVLYSYLTNLVRLRGNVYTKQNLFFLYFQAVDREKGGKKGKKGKKSGKKSGKKARFQNFSKHSSFTQDK